MNEFLIAIILGVVEGLTEFIPVSSTGHLILVGDLLGAIGEREKTFSVFIQLGAILAVLVLYPARFRALGDLRSTEPFGGKRGLALLAIACMPALVAGALLHGTIKTHLFSPSTVGLALIAGGLVMVAVEWWQGGASARASINQITFRDALVVGLFQVLSLWPGFSRSGATICGGMISGLRRDVAAEFSFLVAVPIMVMATSYDLLKSWQHLTSADLPFFVTGFVVSFVSAVVAIRVLVRVVQRYSLRGFAAYRFLLGIVVLVVHSVR